MGSLRIYKINNENAAVMAKWPNLDLADARSKYKSHKDNAKGRNDTLGNPIEFKLTFEQWIDIWMASGHWDQRGPKKGQYCMARFNDIGHYEVGNVKIIPIGDNTREAWTGRSHTDEAKLKIGEAGKGRPAHNKGKTHTEETKVKMKAAKVGKPSNRKGKPMSEEAKLKQSAERKGKPWSEARRAAQEAKKIAKESHEPSIYS